MPALQASGGAGCSAEGVAWYAGVAAVFNLCKASVCSATGPRLPLLRLLSSPLGARLRRPSSRIGPARPAWPAGRCQQRGGLPVPLDEGSGNWPVAVALGLHVA